MKRFLLLLLAVAVIVAVLAWASGQIANAAHVAPMPWGPGEPAWLHDQSQLVFRLIFS